MSDCRYCGVANDDDSREWHICESCQAEKPWERTSKVKELEKDNKQFREALQKIVDTPSDPIFNHVVTEVMRIIAQEALGGMDKELIKEGVDEHE